MLQKYRNLKPETAQASNDADKSNPKDQGMNKDYELKKKNSLLSSDIFKSVSLKLLE